MAKQKQTGINQDELEALGRANPLAFGITYVPLEEERPWTLQNRSWCVEPYQAVNPFDIEKSPIGKARRAVFIKSTQAGITSLAAVKVLHFSAFWKVRSMFMLPRQKDYLDFAATRMLPMITRSKFLSALKGDPFSNHTVKLGGSYIFMMEASVEPRSMPADFLVVDELDLSDPDNVGTAVNRLDASPWKLSLFMSTPTIPAYGIEAMYQESDRRAWMVRCPACNHQQVLNWEKNLRVVGAQSNPEKVFYGCEKCDTELTLAHIQTGVWVPEFPERSSDTVGYHISQMMTKEAPEMWKHYRDPQTKLLEFYRKRLGMPYSIAGGSLDRDDFIANCFDETYEEEVCHDGTSRYFMGVDQGNELQVLIAKLPAGSRRPKVVHIELVPFSDGFDRVGKLMRIFKIRRAVVDAAPNRHSATELQNNFLAKVILADYVEQQKERIDLKKNDKDILTGVNIARTAGFDDLVESIRKGDWALPGTPASLSPMTELLIEHVTSLRRDIETRRTNSGSEIQVAVWRKIRADHLAHSMLYCKIAIEIDQGKSFKSAVIGQGSSHVESLVADQMKANLVNIVSILAEVPQEQIDYLLAHKDADYELPFPLSYKLAKALEQFPAEEVMSAMRMMQIMNR